MMGSPARLIFAVLLYDTLQGQAVAELAARSRSCTSSKACRCQYNVTADYSLIIQCQNAELSAVPTRLEAEATVLKLENNDIKAIGRGAFVTAPNIRVIRLDFNKISYFEEDAFLNLDRLMYLSLAGNNITTINETTFKHLSSLTGLSLTSNPIRYIGKNSFTYLPSLATLFLLNTSIICGCEQQLVLKAITIIPANVTLDIFCGAPRQQLISWPADISTSNQRQECLGTTTARFGTGFCSIAGGGSGRQQPAALNCSHIENACFTTVTAVNGVKSRRDACTSQVTCRQKLLDNPSKCFQNAVDSICNFCCSTGSFCNADLFSWNDRNNASARRNITNLWLVNLDAVPDEDRLREQFRSKLQDLSLKVESSTLEIVNRRSLKDNMSSLTIMVTTSTSLYIGQAGLSLVYSDAMQLSTNASKAHVVPICDGYDHTKDSCAASATKSGSALVTWPVTLVGRSAKVSCPFNFTGNNTLTATRNCLCGDNGTAFWDDPDDTECRFTHDEAVHATEQLRTLLDGPLDPSDKRLENAIDRLMDGIRSSANVSLDVSTMIVNSLSKLYDAGIDRMVVAQRDRSSATSIISGLAALANGLPLTNNDSLLIDAGNLAIAAQRVNAVNFKGISFSMSVANYTSDIEGYSDAQSRDPGVRVTVKSSFLEDVRATNPGVNVERMYFILHKKDTMFQAAQMGTPVAMLTNNSENQSVPSLGTPPSVSVIGSHIIDAGITGVNAQNLTEPVAIRLRPTAKMSRLSCAYWDEGAKKWSRKGLWTEKEAEPGGGDAIVCHSTHLTNFALLMDVDGSTVSEAVQGALSYVSLIGCSISLASVIVTLVATLTRRGLRQDNPGKILVNLCFALAFTNLVFLVLSHFHNGAVCKVTAAVLHFFVLAAFMWMLIEAFYMYLSFIVVFGTHYSRFMIKAAAAGWGVPLAVVVITLSISTDNYGSIGAQDGSGSICWLTGNALHGAFHAPVALILVANCAVFVLVLKRLLATKQNLREDKEKRLDVSKQLRAAASLVALLGLTWLVGFFAIGDAKAALSVLFVVFNSLQGFFIFVFYCALRPDVQRAWYPRLCPCLPPLPEKTSATTSSMSASATGRSSVVSHSSRDSKKIANLDGSIVSKTRASIAPTAPDPKETSYCTV